MTVLQITSFGGEVPSASGRTLPPGSARVARNLHPRVSEFRPLNEDLFAATLGASNVQSLHRLERKADGTFSTDMSTGWITDTRPRSYAKGQINDDLTGRTYYSFDDGSAPPRVVDAGINPARGTLLETTAVDKPLGVPPPGRPTVKALIGDEFTPEEYDSLVSKKVAEIGRVVRGGAVFSSFGSAPAGGASTGYIDMAVTGSSTTAVAGTTTTTTSTTTITDAGVAVTARPEVVAVSSAHVLTHVPYLGVAAYVPGSIPGSTTDWIFMDSYRTFTYKGVTYVTDTVEANYQAGLGLPA